MRAAEHGAANPWAEFSGPGTRRFIKVLRLLEGASLAELTRAVERALELGTADADAVRLVLEHRRERPAGLFCRDLRARGYSEATVWSFADNERANAFYENAGFTRDGAERTEDVWANIPEVRYRRRL